MGSLAIEGARLAEVFRVAPSFLAVFRGPNFVYEFVNEAYYGVVGRRELLGRSVFDVFPESRYQGFLEILRRVLHDGIPVVGREVRIEIRSGVAGQPIERFIDLTYIPLTEPDGTRSGVVSHGSDVTALVRARSEAERARATLEQERTELEGRVAARTAELARANETLTAESRERARAERDRNELRRQLASAEEGERRRLARELHDQLGQHLTAFTLGLDEVARALPSDSPALSTVSSLHELATALARDVRHVAVELRPPELDDLGLESAVASYVERWTERYGVPVETRIAGLPTHGGNDEVTTAIYRLLQEALTNVARHADARHVSLILECRDGSVRLIIEDNGRGFDANVIMRDGIGRERLGLAGMRERAALAGGTLTVEAAPGRGTTIYARLPLPAVLGSGPRLAARDP
jgi:signal transduction histidine kinase